MRCWPNEPKRRSAKTTRSAKTRCRCGRTKPKREIRIRATPTAHPLVLAPSLGGHQPKAAKSLEIFLLFTMERKLALVLVVLAGTREVIAAFSRRGCSIRGRAHAPYHLYGGHGRDPGVRHGGDIRR